MKKVLWIVAAATLFFSCQKEHEAVTPDAKSFTFKASIEKLAADTKADMDGSYTLNWAPNDYIGIYTNNDWAETNQPFHNDAVVGGNQFSWEYGDFDVTTANAAFFPWDGQYKSGDTDHNNIYQTTAWFHLRPEYSDYTSAKMLTPLVAKFSYDVDHYPGIEFKHAAAAVKLNVTNLPKGSTTITMTADKNITGWYSFDLNGLDNDPITGCLSGSGEGDNKTITLNYAEQTSDSDVPFSFIFPVPALSNPKLAFKIKDKNGVTVWSKSLKAQTCDLGRADVLVLNAPAISPYEKFNSLSDTWYVRGNLIGNDWTYDVPVLTDGETFIAKGLSFPKNGAFKIKHADTWTGAFPNENYQINNEEAGKYDVVFDNTHVLAVIPTAQSPYPGSVTLYFKCVTSPGDHDVYFKSSKLGTASWPGDNINSQYEIIAGQKFYKYETTAPAVWGQTVDDMYIVSIDSWNTNASSGDFSDKKNEYFFEATKGAILNQLSGRPADPEITIDGDFSDWADISGNLKTSEEGSDTMLKAYSDGTYLYLYNHMIPNAGVTFDLAGWRYFRTYFDLDNDPTTGWNTSHWLYAGADELASGEDKHCILVYHCKGGLDKASIEDLAHDYEIKAVSNTDGSIEVELKFLLTELASSLTSDEIRIYTSGSVASGKASSGRLTGVMIP